MKFAKGTHPALASVNLFLGLFLFVLGLAWIPKTYLLVNLLVIALAAGAMGGAVGLLLDKAWGTFALRIVSWVSIGTGLALALLCTVSAAYLAGVYGALGRTAAGLFWFLGGAQLLIFVLLPALQLWHLKRFPAAGH